MIFLSPIFFLFQAIISRKVRGAMFRKDRKVIKFLAHNTSLRTLRIMHFADFA
jgi:hypothetical protein